MLMLKGKTVRRALHQVTSDYVAVPLQILSTNQHIVILGDIFFINSVPFLTTISHNIQLTTTYYLIDQKPSTIMKGLKKVSAIYSNRGFILKHALMDGQFEPLCEDLMSLGIDLNVMAANKHVPLIEQQIRAIKERIHATRHLLPFKMIPLLMLIKMVYTCVKWINAFPPKGGVSRMMSPRTIMTGTQLDYKTDCHLTFHISLND